MNNTVKYATVALVVSVSVALFYWDTPLRYLETLLVDAGLLSYLTYVLILTAAVVFMPLTVMPIIPIAASVLGPLVTALLSIVGWSLGGAIAFLIARYLGRPVLTKFMSLDMLDTFIEKLPEKSHFWIIVLLRLTLPVDLVSYALGLTKSLGFTSYIVATIIGVSWFSFAFAYMGEAFFSGNMLALTEITLASVTVFATGWYVLRVHKGDK